MSKSIFDIAMEQEVIEVPKMIVSLETIEDENEVRAEVVALEARMEQMLNVEAIAVEEITKLEVEVKNYESNKSGVISQESYIMALESYVDASQRLTGTVPVLVDQVDLESIDIAVEADKLNNDKKTLLETAYKQLTNLTSSFKIIADDWKFSSKKLAVKNASKIEALLSELKTGDRVMKKEVDAKRAKVIRKRLATMFVTGRKFNLKDIKDYNNLPYQAVVKEKLFEEAYTFAYDNLIVSKSNEKDIPAHNGSIKFLDKINLPLIKKWIPKDVKFGMINNYFGATFTLLTVSQSMEHGADVRHNYFTIPKHEYENVKLTPWSDKDLIALLESNDSLLKNSKDIEKAGTSLFKNSLYKHIRSTLVTVAFTSVFQLLAIKRIFRQIFLGNTFFNGSMRAIISTTRAHREASDLMISITLGMSEQK